jgi:hypothetical protein
MTQLFGSNSLSGSSTLVSLYESPHFLLPPPWKEGQFEKTSCCKLQRAAFSTCKRAGLQAWCVLSSVLCKVNNCKLLWAENHSQAVLDRSWAPYYCTAAPFQYWSHLPAVQRRRGPLSLADALCTQLSIPYYPWSWFLRTLAGEWICPFPFSGNSQVSLSLILATSRHHCSKFICQVHRSPYIVWIRLFLKTYIQFSCDTYVLTN